MFGFHVGNHSQTEGNVKMTKTTKKATKTVATKKTVQKKAVKTSTAKKPAKKTRIAKKPLKAMNKTEKREYWRTLKRLQAKRAAK
jgi:hypothetical protein